ncbi:CRISPR-associated helicase Cas3', partial [Candidatus Woesearchaeota archaeon]|nr:CRISPR-associated helicase Cas3' [Candidatus Woesearchaeota archaeon]
VKKIHDRNKYITLNKLRTKILLEADNNLKESIENNTNNRVFYLKVPTGGGKTNTSLKLALTILQNKPEIKKIFYVFPFINIIEQNYEVIKNTLDLSEKDISPIYSTSSWNLQSENRKEKLMYVLDNEFLNFPFVVMSNVNFFNTFIKSGKSSNYRLINLANSVVILDEIQSLDDTDWTAFNDFIRYSSKYLNIHYIIMSATLPRLDKLDQEKNNSYIDLLEDSSDYYDHECFNDRVNFEYRENINNIEKIPKLILMETKKKKYKKILVVLNTIEDSINLYNELNSEKFRDDYKILLLNSTILSFRRKEIIDKIQNSDDNTILVSTQSVEAGVDIDCDLGIRDLAVFDSIEQVAGRINRNFKKKSAELIIIKLMKKDTSRAETVYRRSYRWKVIRENYLDKIDKFVKSRKFNLYYDYVTSSIKKYDSNPLIETSKNFVDNGIRVLNFRTLNKMKVLDSDSISFFTNVAIPKKNFSTIEQDFLKEQKIIINKKIKSSEVWQAYKNFNKKFYQNMVDSKVDTKIWSAILSQFVINVFNYWKEGQKLSDRLGIKENITFLHTGYSIEKGINPKKITRENIETFDDFCA